MVSRGLHEHRHGTGHDDRMKDGLVAVAVHNDHITRGHGVVPDDLVGGAGAVGHKEAMIGIKNASGIAFAFANGAVVIEQLAQLFHRVANVGAQHVLALKLVVHLAHGAFQKGDTA